MNISACDLHLRKSALLQECDSGGVRHVKQSGEEATSNPSDCNLQCKFGCIMFLVLPNPQCGGALVGVNESASSACRAHSTSPDIQSLKKKYQSVRQSVSQNPVSSDSASLHSHAYYPASTAHKEPHIHSGREPLRHARLAW